MLSNLYNFAPGFAATADPSDYWLDPVLDEIDFTTVEPAAPSIGDRYINTVTGVSSVTGQAVTATYIYEWNGSTWTETIPIEGSTLYVDDENTTKLFNGVAWVIEGGLFKKIGNVISPLIVTDEFAVTTNITTPKLTEAVAGGGIHLSLNGSDGHFYDYTSQWFSMSGSGTPDDGTNLYIPYASTDGWYIGWGMGDNDSIWMGKAGIQFQLRGDGRLTIGNTATVQKLLISGDGAGVRMVQPLTNGQLLRLAGGIDGVGEDGAIIRLYSAAHGTQFGSMYLDFGDFYNPVNANAVLSMRILNNGLRDTLLQAYTDKSIRFFGEIGLTASRISKGWFTDLEITNYPTVNGTALSDQYLATTNSPVFAGITIAGQAIVSVSTGGADNDKLVTQGYVDDAVTGFGNVTAPVNPTDAGNLGEWGYSAGYLYKCIATNTWVRHVVVTTW